MQLLKSTTAAIKDGYHTLVPTCREVIRTQSDALDQSISSTKWFGLRLHLLVCKWCRRYGKQIQFLHHAASEYPDEIAESVPQKLSDEARERIKRRLKDHAD